MAREGACHPRRLPDQWRRFMQRIVIDKPYRFVPPRFSRFWAAVLKRWLPSYLRKSHGVTSWECRGMEKLKVSLQAGHGIAIASNHCRPCDPMLLGLAINNELGCPVNTMASWHLFMASPVQTFLLQRAGAFSIHREGLDRESLNCATGVLARGGVPLIVFPEGFLTRSNDHLASLMDGVAFMARVAAKQRASAAAPGKVVVHPVFIRYFFEGDLAAAAGPVLDAIEKRLAWQSQAHRPLRERIRLVGEALLSLKEIEYLGRAQEGPLEARNARLVNHLLAPLEKERTGGTGGDLDTIERVKRLRTAILPELVDGGLTEEERALRWRQLADLYLVQSLHCYPERYLAGTPSPERLLETVERLEEDLTDMSRPHPPIHALIMIGDGIEAAPARDRKAEAEPVTAHIKQQLEAMMDASQQLRRSPVA